MKIYIATLDTGRHIYETAGETEKQAIDLLRDQVGQHRYFCDHYVREIEAGCFYFDRQRQDHAKH